MSYRRDQDSVVSQRAWAGFVDSNRPAILAAGLPSLATESIQHFDDLVMHGCFDHHPDPAGFNIASLSESQYQEMVRLVEIYFAAGYAWYTPTALRMADQQRLRERFDAEQ